MPISVKTKKQRQKIRHLRNRHHKFDSKKIHQIMIHATERDSSLLYSCYVLAGNKSRCPIRIQGSHLLKTGIDGSRLDTSVSPLGKNHKLGQQVEHKAAIPPWTAYTSLRKCGRDGTRDTSFTSNISDFVRDQTDAASYSPKLMMVTLKNCQYRRF
ncbi:hypothetical protein TcasGA2_TC001539 [Tribolium castaneum]|uniref:Uncharacterized protein n=1 Tax=Tribolium castaneum TaxID=7070 RepID=D7EI60_TRICA|nr:hypothetical protein TcasGA2_TC001539 [Tribolium castaneum]